MASTTNDNLIEKEVTLGGIVYVVKGTVDITITPKTVTPPPPPDPNQPPKPDNFGTIKDGAAWSKNPGKAETWKIVPMKDDPKKFKIIATDGLNVIADLESEAQAKALIEYFKVNVFPPKGNDNSNPDDPDGPLEPGTKPAAGDFPLEVTDKTIPMSQRGVTLRNYASGKPSDWTIEKNAKSIPFDNIVAAFQIAVPQVWEHDDNLSIKLGGTHMGSGWFDNGISVYEGQTCLGYEPDHPETHLCVVKGKKYGDLRGKTVMIASAYYKATNKTEFYVNIPNVTQGWDKACEGKDVGGFKPKNSGNTEVQLRIDGFKEKDQPPNIIKFATAEIKVSAPAPA